MVAPSAWASHILVTSKSEAVQIKDKVGKLKDFQKLARKRAPVLQAKKVETLVGFAKDKWFVNLKKQCGVYLSPQYLNQ